MSSTQLRTLHVAGSWEPTMAAAHLSFAEALAGTIGPNVLQVSLLDMRPLSAENGSVSFAAIVAITDRSKVSLQQDQLLSQRLEELGSWSVRARKAFARRGITCVGELTECTHAQLAALPNCGETTITEIRARLAKAGLSLFEDFAWSAASLTAHQRRLYDIP